MPTPTFNSSCVIFSDTVTGAFCLVVPHTGKSFHKHLENCLLLLLYIPTMAYLRTAKYITSSRLQLCQCCYISCWPVQTPCLLALLPPLPAVVLSCLSHLLCRHSVSGNTFSGFDFIVPCRNNPISCSEVQMDSKALDRFMEARPVCSYSSGGSRCVHLLRKPLNQLLPKDWKVYLRTQQPAFALSIYSFSKHIRLVLHSTTQLVQGCWVSCSQYAHLHVLLSGAVTNCKQEVW